MHLVDHDQIKPTNRELLQFRIDIVDHGLIGAEQDAGLHHSFLV